MYPSRVLKKLRNGEVVRCTKCNISSPDTVEIIGMSGFDCVWLDMEHIPVDYSMINQMLRAAKIHQMDTMVRVSRGGYSDYIKPLEMDASGIMVPHIIGVEDARHVAEITRFHPIGLRALDGGNRDGDYAFLPMDDYMRKANNDRFVIVQIEDPVALAEVDEICAVPGIDMVFFGPADFSQSIGAPGEWDHPELLKAKETVANAAHKHGIAAGVTGSSANFDQLVSMGYNFITMGADVIGLRDYFNAIMKDTDGVSGGDSDSQYK